MNTYKKMVTAIILTVVVLCAVGFKSWNGGFVANEQQEKTSGILNGHGYVDLGLPSGILWSTCNVGAQKPEDYGDYFAWGETQPKLFYGDKNYLYGRGKKVKLTKYCNNKEQGHRGFVDNLTVLESCDDAATLNWGNGWRTPTLEDWQEMINNTTNRYDQIGTLRGRRFIGKNGASIFLPCPGSWQGDDTPYNVGDYGCYWASSLVMEDPSYAVVYYFDYYGELQGRLRQKGYSIRPVCSVPK